MDKDPGLDAVDEERSGQDRRAPSDRRRGSNRLLEMHARREGITDRRQQERREGDSGGEAHEEHGIRRWFSFLRLLKADLKRP